jgi:dipeptidyl aminopeptidase/acylaminoacyl peptidase
VQSGYSGFRHNPVDYATQVRYPVLLLHGLQDPRVTLDQARAIFQNLAGEKEFAQFENAGHESYLAADAGEWKQTVASFLIKYGG